jgi:tetraacyldisaccharide 4'-kinase
MLILRILLIPVSYLYGFIIHIRNLFFDWNIFKSKTYPIPTICVGNIEIGGTGKTPHVEYLIRLLKEKYQIATLSRGYGRKSVGFVEADESKNYKDIGDEPMLFFTKYPDVKVYVDEKRTRGVEKILNENEKKEKLIEKVLSKRKDIYYCPNCDHCNRITDENLEKHLSNDVLNMIAVKPLLLFHHK